MIQVLEVSIKRLDKLAEEWTADRVAKGEDPSPDKDLSIGYNRMIALITQGWLGTMGELLVAEEQIRSLSGKKRKGRIKKETRS